jgi:phosphate transport system substrate-binding protein
MLTIRGSDTMVNLAQRWGERYMHDNPGTVIQISGGGTGTGVAALINGTTDIADASRPMTPREIESVRRARGSMPQERRVALDAVAVYVHRDNPLRSLGLDQLSAIYRGHIRDWSELGGPPGPIVLYSRENTAGTYAYFKERVLGGADFAREAQTLPGTAAVINAVGHDPRGIGYGGIGYAHGVRVLALSSSNGATIAPTRESTRRGQYPLARELYMYTAGPPDGLAANFLAFTQSPAGQELVAEAGYFPLPDLAHAEVP